MNKNPDHYKKGRKQQGTNTLSDIEGRFNKNAPPDDLLPKFEFIVNEIINRNIDNNKDLDKLLKELRKELKITPKKSQLLWVYNKMVADNIHKSNVNIKKLLQTKKSKSESGVLVITVLTSPYPETHGKKQRFTCKWNCYYCPNEPGQPRSYLHDEPAVLRANQNAFDAILQFTDRAMTLANMGHPVDKIELLILGGTWASYPADYQEKFIRDLFYAANTFQPFPYKTNERRSKLSLSDEKLINQTSPHKIIGITLETRPDCINMEEIRKFRYFGCTRIQLGVQHTDDKILKKINRECTTAETKAAIKLLKDCCFKIDIHLMPNLPGSSPEKDNIMFDEILNDPDLQADQWKIYPCEIVPWTIIQKWFENGEFTPYEEEKLFEVLIRVKSKVHPWIRLNRVIRDIPSQYILGGVDAPNMRQYLQDVMHSRGLKCNCIRCREVGLCKNEKLKNNAIKNAALIVRTYESSGGIEYFISYESLDKNLICGFCRLRICDANSEIFPELQRCALIRELHVYGNLIKTTDKKGKHAQNMGFGKKMLQKAELIALWNGYTKIAVISGVGTREYYKKNGYKLSNKCGEFMIKDLTYIWYYLIACISIIIGCLYNWI